MGIYDFCRGKCPNCSHDVDDSFYKGAWQKTGDIQIKFFSNADERFRNYFPRMIFPAPMPYVYTLIGATCCCNTLVDVVSYGTLFCGYRVHVDEEPIENDIAVLKATGFIPVYDTNRYGKFMHTLVCTECLRSFQSNTLKNQMCMPCKAGQSI